MSNTAEISEEMAIFAENVKRVLHEKGWTHTRLAEEAGFSRPGLTNSLNGHGGDFKLGRAGAIARALGVPLHELLRPQL